VAVSAYAEKLAGVAMTPPVKRYDSMGMTDELGLYVRWSDYDALAAQMAGLRAEHAWRPIETAPKGRKLIVGYYNRLGNWRSVMGCYYLPGTLDQDDPDSDDEYAPEGWYEESDSLEQIARTESEPTHWLPLPAPPAATTVKP
jgi:hypothetical protein